MSYDLKHLEGVKLNRLTFLHATGNKGHHGRILAMFRCECGKEKELAMYEWVVGQIQSCGCQLVETAKQHQPAAIRAAAVKNRRSGYEQPACLLAQYF